MAVFALLIKKQSHCNISDIDLHLKRVVDSEDYLKGFCDGYLFNQYKILTLSEYEQKVENLSPSLADYWLRFVTVN
jgi:hypothetical protein